MKNRRNWRGRIRQFFILSITVLIETSCRNNQYKRLSAVFHTKSGKVVDSYDMTPYSAQSNYAIPGTWGETIYNIICKQISE
ncbi:surface-adhesin E family protein [Neisseria chenwenguii]|uniref:surface-adhesin E family protein n=1 Tax=Neisseria chenwenguii TaxID=1853278 RepID=UPI0038CD4F87